MSGGVQVDLRLRKGATISIRMPECNAQEEQQLTDTITRFAFPDNTSKLFAFYFKPVAPPAGE